VNAGGVTVWRIALGATEPPDAAAVAELSQAERTRAARFATDALRNKWLHGHGAMRRILARDLGVDPRRIEYGIGEHGKPFVAQPPGSGIEFSYSDAADVALLAVSRAGPVGVDIEPVQRPAEVDAIAESRFGPSERDALRRLAGEARLERFFRIWARKEAALKATGEGLSSGLAKVEVPVAAALITATPFAIPGSTGRWALEDLDVGPGYVAALVRPEGSTLKRASLVRLVPFEPSHRAAFDVLNRAWLEDAELLEPADEKDLRDPEGAILATGGELWIALAADRPVGTVALRPLQPGVLELVKLSVERGARGEGIGRQLVDHALARAVASGATKVVLTTSSRLTAAIALYDSAGFTRIPVPAWSPYATADVAMEWTRP
jgi:phosphopantetheinyl transferase/ribosomal protein S18 acetylase RimI-like enzyme